MKKLFYVIIPLLAAFVAASCVDEEEFSDSPEGNFEALWKIMDERYCFFGYKADEYGLDWNEVRARYSLQVDATTSCSRFWAICSANCATDT